MQLRLGFQAVSLGFLLCCVSCWAVSLKRKAACYVTAPLTRFLNLTLLPEFDMGTYAVELERLARTKRDFREGTGRLEMQQIAIASRQT